jgi:SNF2 family DNA or RNA helicase
MTNGVHELYSLIHFLRIAPYDVYAKFKADFCCLFRDGNSGESAIVRKNAMTKLQDLLNGILLRRTKDSQIGGNPVLELPKKREEIVYAAFNEDERAYYTALESETRFEFDKYNKFGPIGQNFSNILTLIMRLRQAACHPRLIKDFEGTTLDDSTVTGDRDSINDLPCFDDSHDWDSREKIEAPKNWISSAKIDKCIQILSETGTDIKTLIFSQFTTLLKLLEAPITREKWGFVRYDGSMSIDQRHKAVVNFTEDPRCRVMLISLKAGNAGLNLIAASQVIILDPFWYEHLNFCNGASFYRHFMCFSSDSSLGTLSWRCRQLLGLIVLDSSDQSMYIVSWSRTQLRTASLNYRTRSKS